MFGHLWRRLPVLIHQKGEAMNSPLWKRVIAWERSHAASGYGIVWGDADRSIQGGISAECHSVDCSGHSNVLTELQIAMRSRLLF